MGMFDKPNEDKLSDDFPEGTPFMLYEAEYEGMKNTSFGESHQATVTAGPADRSGETKDYRVFGRLAEQIKKMESSDLPAIVKIVKYGRAHTWEKVEVSQDVPF